MKKTTREEKLLSTLKGKVPKEYSLLGFMHQIKDLRDVHRVPWS